MNSTEQKTRVFCQEFHLRKVSRREPGLWRLGCAQLSGMGTPFASAGPEGLVCASRIGRVGNSVASWLKFRPDNMDQQIVVNMLFIQWKRLILNIFIYFFIDIIVT